MRVCPNAHEHETHARAFPRASRAHRVSSQPCTTASLRATCVVLPTTCVTAPRVATCQRTSRLLARPLLLRSKRSCVFDDGSLEIAIRPPRPLLLCTLSIVAPPHSHTPGTAASYSLPLARCSQGAVPSALHASTAITAAEESDDRSMSPKCICCLQWRTSTP